MSKAFEFKQCAIILKSTGKKAKSLGELRDVISEVNEASIFHHFYHYFLKEHVREYTNDFAHWAGEGLEERALAEMFSNIDPYDFTSIDDLRRELNRGIDEYLAVFPEPREALSGAEFFFNETISLVFAAGIRAKNLAEMLMAMKYVDDSSLYYHFYDARIRLGNRNDDFSVWFEEALEKENLARRVRAVDPFMHSLGALRERLITEIDQEVKKDMESAGVD
jgi:hypothetical protein